VRLPGGPARFLKTQYLIAAIILATIAVGSASGFVWADKRVTLVVDGVVRVTMTEAPDVASLLDEVGVHYSSVDLVSPSPKTDIEYGDTVVVRHAVPVTLDVGGEVIRLNVIGRTVADALVSAGFDPTCGMNTDPPVDALLEPGMRISATEVFMRVVEEQVEVPFDVEVVGDANASPGSRTVTTPGVAGKGVRVYQVLVVGGVEGPRFLKAEHTLSPAVREVVVIGTKSAVRQVLASRARNRAQAPPGVAGRTMIVHSTSYSPWDATCSGHISTIRAKMRKYRVPAGWGLVAVDPRVIPLGSRLYLEGYGYAVAGDTGGVIKGDKIDVCFWGADSNASYEFSDDDPTAVAPARAAARAAAHQWMHGWGNRSISLTILGD
jgi:uncharacterized protein YabE (DUF348 family)/3D (Asp-Asp-Asp) domain-containing protein